MPLDVPNLDDRRWADLVQEARALIPRLSPEWTDHNVHDPGITLIELFAWLAEMQIYQLNRVNARHRVLFARLAGVTRLPLIPARVNIAASGNTTSQLIPRETQIVPVEADGLVFETTTPVRLTRSTLTQVIVDDGSGPVDQTDANRTAGTPFLAFGEAPRPGSELRLVFDGLYPDEQTIRLTFDVFSADLERRCGDAVPIPSNETGAPLSPVDVAWEYEAEGGRWRPLTVTQDDTLALSRSGTVVILFPGGLPGTAKQLRCRIVRGTYDIEPRLDQIVLNVLPCVQVETVRNELLGRGDARPDQSCVLAHGPVMVPPVPGQTVRVEVGGEPWQLTETFDRATPDSKQFTFDPDTRQVSFGNGFNGLVPLPGQDIRAVWYQTSAGRSGNVTRGLTWKFRTLIVPGVSLTNTQPATGGAEVEPLGEMELRARALMNRPQRAVTLEDIERIALGTPGARVARAHALANCPVPERITVVALPKVRPGRSGAPPRPSSAFLAAVQQHLDARRLLCDNIRVVPPVYVELRISASLQLAKGAGAAAVVERARDALNAFLTGIPDDEPDTLRTSSPCPTRWPIGRGVFPSDVYAVLDRVAGVEYVEALTLHATRDGNPIAPDRSGAIRVPRIALIVPGTHDLAVASALGRSA
jgi:predicted phage baseplate assembly protein